MRRTDSELGNHREGVLAVTRGLPDSGKETTMDKSMIKGLVIGGIAMVVLTAGGVTGYRAMTKPTFADVVAIKEVTQTVNTPREECQDVQVQKQAPVKDPNRITGTVIGGVAGGVLGHQVGGGTGKTIATVAG